MKRKVLQGVAVVMLLLMSVAAIPRIANAITCEWMNETNSQAFIDYVMDDVLDMLQLQYPMNTRIAWIEEWLDENPLHNDWDAVNDDLNTALEYKADWLAALAACNDDISVANIAHSNEDYCPGVDDALTDVLTHIGEGVTAVEEEDFWLGLCEETTGTVP